MFLKEKKKIDLNCLIYTLRILRCSKCTTNGTKATQGLTALPPKQVASLESRKKSDWVVSTPWKAGLLLHSHTNQPDHNSNPNSLCQSKFSKKHSCSSVAVVPKDLSLGTPDMHSLLVFVSHISSHKKAWRTRLVFWNGHTLISLGCSASLWDSPSELYLADPTLRVPC